MDADNSTKMVLQGNKISVSFSFSTPQIFLGLSEVIQLGKHDLNCTKKKRERVLEQVDSFYVYS